MMYHCGGYAICRMLLCVFALTCVPPSLSLPREARADLCLGVDSWMCAGFLDSPVTCAMASGSRGTDSATFTHSCFLFLACAFATLLASTIYFMFRRSSPFPIFTKSFLAVDWERYSGRPVNRAATVKRVRKGAKGDAAAGTNAPRTLEGDDSRFGGDGRLKRDDSCAPVLPFAHGYGHGRTGSSLNASVRSGAGTLDWDVQSTLTDATRPSTMFGAYAHPHGAGPYGSEPGTPRREDQVFVLDMGGDDEETEKATASKEAEEEKDEVAAVKELGSQEDNTTPGAAL